MAEKFISIEDILSMQPKDDVETRVVEVPNWPKVGAKGKLRLAQVDADGLTKWSDDNDKDRKTAGVRILALSIQAGSETAVSDEQAEKLVEAIRKRTGASLNKLVTEALELNELTEKKTAERKNDSGEAETSASPIS